MLAQLTIALSRKLIVGPLCQETPSVNGAMLGILENYSSCAKHLLPNFLQTSRYGWTQHSH